MIGTIRKHSSWLWWLVAGLTIISFIYWGASPATRNGSGRSAGYGMIYGQKITADDYAAAQREFLLFYWQRNGAFPEKNPNFTRTDLERETYVRLMLAAKARELGIHVSDDAQVAAADEFLRSLTRDGQAVPMNNFMERILQPEGLDATDFQRFIVNLVTEQQLVQVLGLSGGLVPPQEAAQLYDRDHQEVSAQAVFFSASNYLSQVTASKEAVSQFYTNYMAHYRLPDRVQVNYVEYDLTNFLTAVLQKFGETNLDAQVDAYYAQKGAAAVPDAKTPEEAKATIRETMLRQAAAKMALDQAGQFVRALFAMDPVSRDNLVTLAKTDGLAVQTTAPFTEEDGPAEFAAPEELTKIAFKLNDDSPFSKPIAAAEAVYVIGLANLLPSSVPSFSEIHAQVVRDYQNHEAAVKARTAGTNFYYSATVQMAVGKTFAQAALAAGQTPFALKPFSLSSKDVPEADGHADIREIKNVAFFTTQPGHISEFEPTADGGFVLYVHSLLPVDEALKNSELPQFVSQLRRNREIEAFNQWVESEANRELRNTPVYAELMGNRSSSPSP